MEADAYRALRIEQTYSTTLSDQSEVELVPGGSDIIVECKDRAKYSEMVRKARMMENIEQVSDEFSFIIFMTVRQPNKRKTN